MSAIVGALLALTASDLMSRDVVTIRGRAPPRRSSCSCSGRPGRLPVAAEGRCVGGAAAPDLVR